MTALPSRGRWEFVEMTEAEIAEWIKLGRPLSRNIDGVMVRVRLRRTKPPDNAFITANEREIS